MGIDLAVGDRIRVLSKLIELRSMARVQGWSIFSTRGGPMARPASRSQGAHGGRGAARWSREIHASALFSPGDRVRRDADWPQILALYDLFGRMSDNPMVLLNRAVAAAMVHGQMKGLELLDALASDARLAGHHRVDSVRAHLLELAGDREGAAKKFRTAAGETGSLPERDYLLAQAARLADEHARGRS
jgi:hypothetical protein